MRSALLLTASTLIVAAAIRLPTFLPRRPFETRGVYPDRPDQPPLNEIARRVGVPAAPWHAPRWAWKGAWQIGKAALPILHRWDDCRPTDTNVNLWVCWLKAIGGGSRFGFDDDRLAYDLLPPATRRVVARPLASLYPLLHHQNVVLRTAYLDTAVAAALSAASEDSAVVCLGAGFDLRSLRLTDGAARWVEIDLPHVIEQRGRLLNRLAKRRPLLAARVEALRQHSANLTRAEEMRAALRSACRPLANGGHVVFVVEALLIYLPPEASMRLLEACADEARAAGAASATLCYADRLPGLKGASLEDGRAVLRKAGWANDDEAWLPKPGLARHMGVARASFR